MQLDLDKLRSRLADEGSRAGDDDTVPAAVLIPFIRRDDDWELVFTLRREDLPSHAGQISFPGGKVEASEGSREAALREAEEELGIDPAGVDVLGCLPTVLTVVSGFTVEPWVGILSSDRFVPNPSEIAEVIEVPLGTLRDPRVRRTQHYIRAGAVATSSAFDIDDHIIWGATARIVDELLTLIG